MRMRWPLVLILSVLVLPSGATAQDRGKAGLFMAYPTTIGIRFNVSPKVAIRPDAGFSTVWNDSTSTSTSGATGTSSSTGRGVNATIAVLFYLRERESLNLYFAPGFSYARSSTTSASASSSAPINVYALSGSVGAERPISRRFGVFGELGLRYSRRRTENVYTTSTSRSLSQSIGTTASIGTILYF